MSENEGATIGNLIYSYSILCLLTDLLIIINPMLVEIVLILISIHYLNYILINTLNSLNWEKVMLALNHRHAKIIFYSSYKLVIIHNMLC